MPDDPRYKVGLLGFNEPWDRENLKPDWVVVDTIHNQLSMIGNIKTAEKKEHAYQVAQDLNNRTRHRHDYDFETLESYGNCPLLPEDTWEEWRV